MNWWKAIRTAINTVLASAIRPVPGLPPPNPVIDQPPGTNWCGPAVACMLHRAILRREYDLEQAKRELLGSWPDGTTSSVRLAEWLQQRGMRSAHLVVPPGGLYEAVGVALAGGAYAVPLVWALPGRAAHFVILHWIDRRRDLVYGTNSVTPHEIEWSARHLEQERAVRVDADRGRTPLVIVR